MLKIVASISSRASTFSRTSSRSFSLSTIQSSPHSNSLVTTTAPLFFSNVGQLHSPKSLKDSNTFNGTPIIPAFRVLNGVGGVIEAVEEEWKQAIQAIPEEKLVNIYKKMSVLPILDTILYASQRQGRISFMMTSFGEEGAVIGSAAAWQNDDEVFSQYRETGVLLWRDYPLKDLMAQVFSTKSDSATKARQMPIHHGSAAHHFHTVSSPLATQIPQAAGAAYALKISGREKSCVICYFGEGAASEGDFHAGLNMAATLGCPTIFFVRNNGFAISTPSSEQYKGDGIVSRGPGYGIESIRVDGNDPLAVYLVCQEARRRAVEGSRPILIEAMSYRVSHHSTSDDSSAYRSMEEVDSIKKNDSPIMRLRGYLDSRSLWSDEQEEKYKSSIKKMVIKEFNLAEKESKPELSSMFEDVFAGGAELERPLREQKEELQRLVRKYGSTTAWKKRLEKFEGGQERFLA